MKSISFLLFAAGDCPGGGLKVIYQHANHLASLGCDVHIVYPAAIDARSSGFLYKINRFRIFLKRKYKIGFSCRNWFALNERVKEHWVYSLNYKNVPKTDVYIATEARTSIYLNQYPIDQSNKYYFIQSYETWVMNEKKLRETYRFNLNKFTIAQWICNIVVNEEKRKCMVVPNGFDFDEYKITIPIQEKNKYEISMLYHQHEEKGCRIAIEALKLVKKQIPQLKVFLFGTYKKPDLPEWFHYFEKPNKDLHLQINNSAAIHIGASSMEGFGLTIGEAMLCGQAVACSDNPGYKEMAIDSQTALLSPINDIETLAKNIIKLISNDSLRYRLAAAGYEYVRHKFSWEKSYDAMEKMLKIRVES